MMRMCQACFFLIMSRMVLMFDILEYFVPSVRPPTHLTARPPRIQEMRGRARAEQKTSIRHRRQVTRRSS